MNGNQGVIKALLLEIDGSTEKLRRALRDGGVELDKFDKQSKETGRAGAATQDVFAGKVANSSRAVASATENIARQGKVTGESGKQLIAQAANIAFAFGPHGAIVGAIGISMMAVTGMISRTKRELAELEQQRIDTNNRFAEMDAIGQARALNRLRSGVDEVSDDFRTIRALPEDRRRQVLEERGLTRLTEERQALERAIRESQRGGDLEAARTGLGRFGFMATLNETNKAREFLKELQEAEERLRHQVARGTDELQKSTAEQKEREDNARTRVIPTLHDLIAAERQLREARDGVASTPAQRAQVESELFTAAVANAQRRIAALPSTERQAANEALLQQMAPVTQTMDRAIARADAALDKFQRESQDFERQFKEIVAHGLTGSVRDINLAFESLRATALRTGNADKIPILEAARAKAVALAEELSNLDRTLARYAREDVEKEFARTAAITIDDDTGQRRKLELEAQFRELQKQKAATEDLARVQAAITELVTKHAKAQAVVGESVSDTARALGDAVDGALQLAAAMGSVDNKALNVLRSVSQIGFAIPGLLEQLKILDGARDRTATDKSGKLVTEGAALLGVSKAALPIVGALATLGTTLFGGDSPAERERKRVQRENTKALQELTARVGSTGINLTGSQFGEASRSVRGLLAGSMRSIVAPDAEARALMESRRTPGSGPLEFEFDLSRFSDRTKIDWKRLTAEGVDRGAMERAARELGITLDGTVGSFRKLMAALDEVEAELGEFGESFSERRAIDELKLELRGVTDPTERLLGSTAAARAMSPVIAQLFEGLDLTKAEDREKLTKALLSLVETMEAGGDSLTKEQLGELTRDEIFDLIQQINAGLGSIGSASAQPTSSLGGISGFRGLTEAAGTRMGDYLRSLDSRALRAEGQRERANELLEGQLQYLSLLAATPLTLPSVPGLPTSAGAGARGATTVLVEVNIGGVTVQVLPGDDAVTQGTAVAQAIAAQAGELLYREVSRGLKVDGDLGVTVKVN